MSELPFVPGLTLSEWMYEDAVRPLLTRRWPSLFYSAARLGHGSEVLGYDTAQSMDHDWGPRLSLFLADDAPDHLRTDLSEGLAAELTDAIRGYPLALAWNGSAAVTTTAGHPAPRIDVMTLREFSQSRLGLEPDAAWTASDWLAMPEQILLSLTRGRVFHDGLETIEPFRSRLRYYPDQVWLYLLAAGWGRIGQEEAFMGRCGQVGDELGSRLVAARLVRDLMRLCFLMERQYAPYIKWLGTAFARLACAPRFLPLFEAVWRAETWADRQGPLVAALEAAAGMHNALGLTPSVDPSARPFYDRPFLVLDAGRFASALRERIGEAEVLALPEGIGGLDQWVDSTDVLEVPARFSRLRGVFSDQ